jgi:hypothetical protein
LVWLLIRKRWGGCEDERWEGAGFPFRHECQHLTDEPQTLSFRMTDDVLATATPVVTPSTPATLEECWFDVGSGLDRP